MENAGNMCWLDVLDFRSRVERTYVRMFVRYSHKPGISGYLFLDIWLIAFPFEKLV